MLTRTYFSATVAVFVIAATTTCPVGAQMPNGGFPPGFAPTPYNMGGPLMDAHGDPAVIPAQYCQGGCPSGGCSGGYAGGYGGPTPCDPFYGAGAVCEQCGPHYFDFSFDYLMYDRSSYGDANSDLMSLQVSGDPVLSSSDLDAGLEPGFRLTGRYDIAALSVLEVSYSGFFDMGDLVGVVDPTPNSPTEGNLFSLYTNFGVNPSPPQSASPAFDETDRAVSASLGMESELHTAEITFRRYWVGHSPRVSGTWLAGFRWTRLKDKLNFNTVALGSYNNLVETENDLSGFQVGGDAWLCPRQGFRIGFEGKGGLYGNQVNIRNLATTSSGGTLVNEILDYDEVSFICEMRLMAVADILPNWSIKAGYEALYITSVANAFDNFNPGSPYTGAGVARTANQFDTEGDALFGGFQVSTEYIW